MSRARKREGVVSQRELRGAVWVGELPRDADAAPVSARPERTCALLYAQSGELQIVPPTSARELADGVRSVKGWAVIFDQAALTTPPSSPVADSADTIETAILLRSAWQERSRYQLPATARPTWEANMQRLRTELGQAAPGDRVAAVALLTLLMIDAARLASPAPPSDSARTRKLVRDVSVVIDHRFRERLTLADVAGAVFISPSHLSRLLRRTTSRTVGEWIRDRRMEEARQLLLNTDAPVETIAISIGYRDVTHFRRQFQRTHDTTPARWRERVRC